MLPYPVSEKFVVCGSFIEHYAYEKPYWVGFPRFRRQLRFRAFQRPKTPQTVIRVDNIRRTRGKIRRLVNCNRDLIKFMTLTFNTSVVDLNLANPIFHSFIKRLHRLYPNFKYLCVPEFQKKGRVHYHLLCNLPFVENSFITDLWGQGFVFLRKVDHINNVGAYVCKYLGKANFDGRYFKKKKFFYSVNLLRPVVVDNYDDVQCIWQGLPVDNSLFVEKTYNFSYCSDFLGVIEYSQYKAVEYIKVVPSELLERRADELARLKLCQKKSLDYLLEVSLLKRKPQPQPVKQEKNLQSEQLKLM